MKLNKKQKRTATIASMAALLAVVLGMGGQTFAKYYATNNAPAQTATVAKWGVVINTTIEGTADIAGTPIFKANYNDAVVSSSSKTLVAPGTSGSYGMLITGTPEVKTAVEINLVIDDVYVTVGGKTYYPIVWTYNDEDYNGSEVATMITKVKENNKTYAANADLGDIDATISWAWAFENTALDSNANDYDTILGDMSAKEVEELETKLGLAQGNTELSVQFTASVTQVQ